MPTVATPRQAPAPLNGVNTPALFATIDAVKGAPALAAFQFRATNRWVSGTCSETAIESFTGAGGEHQHKTVFRYQADHPAVLVGQDRAPTPVEFLLHALASCICSGIGNIAAARGVTLTSVESTIEGDIDLQGILGISKMSATAISSCGCAWPSPATHRPRCSRGWSSRRGRVRRSTTC